MPKNTFYYHLSFSAKLSLLLSLLALVLLTLLILLIIPKMQKEQYEYKIKQIEQTIDLNTQQLKLSVDYIISDGKNSSLRTKEKFLYELYKMENKVFNINNIRSYLNTKEKDLKCEILYLDENLKIKYKKNIKNKSVFDEFIEKKIDFNTWKVFIKKDEETFCPSITKHVIYRKKLKNNDSLLLMCNTKDIQNNDENIEEKIKTYIQKSFSFTENIHKGNTFLM